MDTSVIASLITPAIEIASKLLDLVDKYKSRLPSEIYTLVYRLNNHLIKLQSQIFIIQQENLKLQDEIKYYKDKIDQYEQWEQTKKEYKLFDFGNGVFVRVKVIMKEDKQLNWFFCPKCFENKVISPLSWERKTSKGFFYKCPTCNAGFYNIFTEKSPSAVVI